MFIQQFLSLDDIQVAKNIDLKETDINDNVGKCILSDYSIPIWCILQ